MALGGGRTAPEQIIDPAVGFDRLLPVGARVEKGQPIARVHAANEWSAAAAAKNVVEAYTIGEGKPMTR